MALGDVWQIRYISRFGEQLGMNIRQYLVTLNLGGGSVGAPEVAGQMQAAFVTAYRSLLNENADYVGTGAQKIRPLPPAMEAIVGTAPPTAGIVTGDAVPKQSSGLISLRTALAGRRFRGRVYVPFPGEGENSAIAEPEAVYLSKLQALAIIFLSNISVTTGSTTETLSPVIFHRDTGTTDRITSAIVRSGWATQRRRGTFGRPNPVASVGSIVIGL